MVFFKEKMVQFYKIVVEKVEKFYVNKRPLDVVFFEKGMYE